MTFLSDPGRSKGHSPLSRPYEMARTLYLVRIMAWIATNFAAFSSAHFEVAARRRRYRTNPAMSRGIATVFETLAIRRYRGVP